MKNNWDSMLTIAQKAIEDGKVDENLLKNMRDQVTNDNSMLLDEHLPVIQSLHKIAIDDKMVKKMSRCTSGKELMLSFYEELQSEFPINQKKLLDDIFAEVTEWVKQQR